jgi:hypothetical protein
VALLAPFPYAAGTAAYAPADLTCGRVSCHGAQTTPGWRTTGATCTNCHKARETAVNGAPGDYYTDYTENWITHNDHIGRAAGVGGGCGTCHTALPSGVHFGSFADKAIAGRAAAATINPAFGYPANPPPPPLLRTSCGTGSLGGNCH